LPVRYKMKFALISHPRFLLLFYICCAAVIPLHAQVYNNSTSTELRGQVEHADGSPFVDGALVKIEYAIGGVAAQVMTDSHGRFDAALTQRARYIVTVHVPGFHDASSEVDLETMSRATVRLTLRELPASGAAVHAEAQSGLISANDLNVPEGARTEFEKGRILLLEKHKTADSVKSLLKAIQMAPSYSQAHFLLGTAYLDMGKPGDAETELAKAISLNDKLDAAYLALGSCLIEEKKFSDAEKPLLRGLELLPDSAQGHYDLGRAYYALNRYEDAETHARKAIELAPDLPEAHLLLGNVLLRLRDGPHALAEFQAYLRLAPNGPFAGPAQELVKKLQAALADAH
jgi:Flp pilus assembly protein TadD